MTAYLLVKWTIIESNGIEFKSQMLVTNVEFSAEEIRLERFGECVAVIKTNLMVELHITPHFG